MRLPRVDHHMEIGAESKRASLLIVLAAVWGCENPKNDGVATATAPVEKAVPSKEVSSQEQPATTTAPRNRETALLAGGCFWGMEEIIRDIPGVLETEVGYAGGTLESPAYEQVKQGNTGHAESIRVVFDPGQLSYTELLEKWFFRMHDPTTKNRQGNDVGTQYRSAIFYESPAQKATAEAVIARVEASGMWPQPIVTEVVPAGAFTAAESYHQDYLEKNPGGYTCHFLRDTSL